MTRETFARFAQIIFGLVFIFFGINHFLHAGAIGNNVPTFLPGKGEIYVYLTGMIMVIAGACFLIQRWVTIPAILLAITLLMFAFMIHFPGWINGSNPMSQSSFLKDVGLAMASLYLGTRSY